LDERGGERGAGVGLVEGAGAGSGGGAGKATDLTALGYGAVQWAVSGGGFGGEGGVGAARAAGAWDEGLVGAGVQNHEQKLTGGSQFDPDDVVTNIEGLAGSDWGGGDGLLAQ